MWTVNFQMFKLALQKAEEPKIKLPTFAGSLKKQESSRKNIYFCFIDYAKAFDCVDHKKLWKILKEMGIPDHLTCLLRNLYAGQEVTVMEKEMATHSLPGESQGRRSLVGSRLWGRTESDTTAAT